MSLLEDLFHHQILTPEVWKQSQGADEDASENHSLLQQLAQWRRRDLLDESKLLSYLSEQYGIPLLSQLPELPQLPEESASNLKTYEETQILCIDSCNEQKNTPIAILSLDSDWSSINALNFQRETPFQCFLASSHEVSRILAEQNPSSTRSLFPEDASVMEQVHQLLENALAARCSDIHLEPRSRGLIIRFRIDGYLKEEPSFPIELQALILSRIKLISGMDIAIRRHSQDGNYTYHSRSGQVVDLRVSSLPTQSGEKLVLRLLEQTSVQHKLETLGFFKEDLKVLREVSCARSGLILVVGPTGSGKTTTLYALLNEMDHRQKNIITIENPVEYHLSGINQVSVDSEHGVSFADTLRASLRQDPDVILVGEIRDEETAEIAVRAALTGHLVLSTLHSNDASTCIQRLINLGVSADLLSETLKLVLSQRLLRRACTHSELAFELTHPESEIHCSRCQNTGYSGRIPIYELLKINTLLRERICSKMTGEQLIAPDKDLYFHSMKQTANRLLKSGLTDKQELQSLFL